MKFILVLLTIVSILYVAGRKTPATRKMGGRARVKAENGDSGGGKGDQADKDGGGKKALQGALGKSAKPRPLNGGLGPIIQASDLKCDFGLLEICNWGNVRNESLKWGILDSDTSIDAKKFKNTFDTKQTSAPFAAVASGPTNETDKATLISGLIPCQKEDGQLSFGYYLSDGVKLQVCRQGMDKTIIEPCQEFTGADSATVAAIPGGSPEMFRIAFIASNFKDGGVALIKRVQYGAKFCRLSQ